MMELKKFDIMSMAKINALIMAVFGFFIGLVYGIIVMVIMAASQGPAISVGVGVLMIVGMPILYGLMGFVFGAIGAALYNVIAAKIGGIKLEFRK